MAEHTSIGRLAKKIPRPLSTGIVLCLFLAAPSLPLCAEAETQIETFSPEGTVREVRQVSVRFSASMTALGDPRAVDPFTIDCTAPGHGYWADDRNWIYDFEADLPGGIGCTFTLHEGLAALDGTPVEGPSEYRFDTGGPAIRASLPFEADWSRVDENQIFILAINAPATAASVRANAYCLVPNLAERIPVRVLEGAEREDVLAQRRKLGYSYYQILWADGMRTGHQVRDRSVEQAEQSLTVLACARTLPPDTEFRLVWGSGIAAPGGIATTQDQALSFRTRPAFTALLQCARVNEDAGCIPFGEIRVRFSAPVPRDTALTAWIEGPEGLRLEPETEDPETPTVEAIAFPPVHRENTRLSLHLPADLKDDAGRPLENAARFPLEFATDSYPPLAKFAGPFGILETAEGGVLPVTVRNVGAEESPGTIAGHRLRVVADPVATARWMLRHERFRDTDQPLLDRGDPTEPFTLPVPDDGRDAEVIGIPLVQPGFYLVELASPRLGAMLNDPPSTRYVRAAALVTNLAVHFKWGRERSVIWVTRLDNGQPVANAEVAITNLCDGSTIFSGRSDTDGTTIVGPKLLPEPRGYGYCRIDSTVPIYFISARVGDDLSFTRTDWVDGIEPYAFRLPTGTEAAAFHTVFDRPLYRAGEVVSMKHFQRRREMAGLGLEENETTLAVRITHMGSDTTYPDTVQFGTDGIAEQTWQIPENAKLGLYSVSFSADREDKYSFQEAGSFQVQEFRVPLMQGVIQGPAGPQARPQTVPLDLHLRYLSGGSAARVPVTVRSARKPMTLRVAGYEDYIFSDIPLTAGRTAIDYSYDPEAEPQTDSAPAETLPVTLDDAGAARVSIPIGKIDKPEQLVAEFDYPDANGEIFTVSNTVELRPAALTIGLRRDESFSASARVRFRVAVLDLAGKPVARQRVTARIYQRERYGYRKRLIGGFYAYENYLDTRLLEANCSGRTDTRGLLSCDIDPGVPGEVLIRAETTDTGRRTVAAATSIWRYGDADDWQGSSDTDRMDLLPERREYEAGETARFNVQMPFRKATALVTVEREGVINHFVTELSGSEPVVKVPIEPGYAPNVYVSVLAVRGRVADGQNRRADRARARGEDPLAVEGGMPTAFFDPAKPAYRLGNAAIRVGWKPYRLEVAVTPDRPVYRTREEMQVKVKAKRAGGGALPPGAEIALAVVDEGLLQLAPNPSWDLLDAMMAERGIEVWTSTAQMQVVGKRHYGRKAVPAGGGGGQSPARELFDTLLAWRGRVALDANGEATATVPINDSLTSFRIVAIAHAGAALFGTGASTVSTTQDLILYSGLPQRVRSGDVLDATFTVRNASEQPLAVDVNAAAAKLSGTALTLHRITLEPGTAHDLAWQVTVPHGQSTLDWEVVASAEGGASDRLKVIQEVVAAIPVRTLQATLTQVEGTLNLPLARPADAVPDQGGVRITLQPKLATSLAGVLDYMRDYPYLCIEQVLSKAVALRDAELWQTWIAKLPSYQDKDGLVRYFPDERLPGEDILTSYILAIGDASGWAIPQTTRQRLLDALTAFVEGKLTRRAALATNDLAIRKLAAIAALSRYGPAPPELLDSVSIRPNLWPTSALLDWIDILHRLHGVPDRDARRAEALRILRARFDFRGTAMTLSTERTDALWWLMVSTDANTARALVALLHEAESRDELPRIARGLINRQVQGHWNTTVANAWGVLALTEFSSEFEGTPVSGTTHADYGGDPWQVDWSTLEPVTSVEFGWQDTATPLALSHDGSGKPWALVQARAAIPLKDPLFAGYRITRTLTPIEQRTPGVWTRGDLVRVHLDLEAQTDMSWVVVDDPVPAGATIIGDLGGQSRLAQSAERERGWAWTAYAEHRADAYRAYYRWVPKGAWSIEYTLRLNNPGEFVLPSTRVEAMYAPETFGELPNAPFRIDAAP